MPGSGRAGGVGGGTVITTQFMSAFAGWSALRWRGDRSPRAADPRLRVVTREIDPRRGRALVHLAVASDLSGTAPRRRDGRGRRARPVPSASGHPAKPASPRGWRGGRCRRRDRRPGRTPGNGPGRVRLVRLRQESPTAQHACRSPRSSSAAAAAVRGSRASCTPTTMWPHARPARLPSAADTARTGRRRSARATLDPTGYQDAVRGGLGAIAAGEVSKVVLARDLAGTLPAGSDLRRLAALSRTGYPDTLDIRRGRAHRREPRDARHRVGGHGDRARPRRHDRSRGGRGCRYRRIPRPGHERERPRRAPVRRAERARVAAAAHERPGGERAAVHRSSFRTCSTSPPTSRAS